MGLSLSLARKPHARRNAMPRKRHESTPLERRMRHAEGWPEPKTNAKCWKCRDAGWFYYEPRAGEQFAYACACAAGEQAPPSNPSTTPHSR